MTRTIILVLFQLLLIAVMDCCCCGWCWLITVQCSLGAATRCTEPSRGSGSRPGTWRRTCRGWGRGRVRWRWSTTASCTNCRSDPSIYGNVIICYYVITHPSPFFGFLNSKKTNDTPGHHNHHPSPTIKGKTLTVLQAVEAVLVLVTNSIFWSGASLSNNIQVSFSSNSNTWSFTLVYLHITCSAGGLFLSVVSFT